MEGIKNANLGSIDSGGGSVQLGDTYINDLSTAYNQVYKERVTEIEKFLHSFKPKTARQLLDQLEIDISQKERIENIVKSKISFLKATCDDFLSSESNDVSLAFINTYKLNETDFKLKEIASLEYLKLKELDKAQELVDEILKVEEYNPTAWAVKALLFSSINLESALNQVPDFVRNNIIFRRIVYFHSKRSGTYEDLHIAFPKFQVLMKIEDFDEKPLSFQNFKERIFLIESLLSTYSQRLWISFHKQEIEDEVELTKVHRILELFVKEISETEIQSTYPSIQFFAAYFNYQLFSNVESVHEMLKFYQKMPAKPLYLLMMTANSLQQIEECDKAIEVIEQQEEKDITSLELLMFCHIKKNDGSSFLSCVKEYLKVVDTITLQKLNNYFFIPHTLYDFGLLDEIEVLEFLANKTFESEEIKAFFILFIQLLKGEKIEEVADELIAYYNKLSSVEQLYPFFAHSFYLIGNYEESCKIYEKYVRKDIENSDLYSYIISLHRSKNRHKDLLPLLSHWRSNFSFQESFVRLEIELRKHLFDWEEIINCCEYMFEQQKINEFNLINYAIAIHESETPDKDEKIRLLLSYMEKIVFTSYTSYSTIITVLERSNFQDEALELLYSKAKEKSISQARMEYFSFTSFREQKYLESYDEVKEGCFLKFKMNGSDVYAELTKENEYLEYLLGKKVGDEVLIPGKFGGQGSKITILRIMNKYLALYDEILEEVQSNPMSKIPMQSFDMTEYIDGNKSIIEFFEQFGGKTDQELLNQNFKKYYDHEITFSELVLNEFSMNFLKAYYCLIKEREGLTQINALQLGIISLQKYDEFILDFTSLLRYFELSKSMGITYDIKFTVAASTVSLIRTYSTEFPPVSGKEYVLDQNYYKELLAWIKENCQMKMPISKLDAVAMAKDKKPMSVVQNYGLDNCCLLIDNENALLITDDLFYFKMFSTDSRKIISPWLFDHLNKS
jgi:hypothetical protein